MPLSANLFRLESSIQKHAGSRVASPRKKKEDFFSSKLPIFYFIFFKFTWKIRNWLNRKKNHISDFCNSYFSSYGHFCTQNVTNFRWIFTHNSKHEYQEKKVFCFSFVSTHSASFIKMCPLLRGGCGVCISSLVGKKPTNQLRLWFNIWRRKNPWIWRKFHYSLPSRNI